MPICVPLRKTLNATSGGTARAGLAMPTASRPPPTSANASLRPIGEIDPSGELRTARGSIIISSILLEPLAGRQLLEAPRHRICSRVFLDPLDPCVWRPAMTRVDHLPDRGRSAGEQRLDGTIRPIAHPSAQSAVCGLADHPAAKPNTLNLTIDPNCVPSRSMFVLHPRAADPAGPNRTRTSS